jgi:predicted double-glycine peptidase
MTIDDLKHHVDRGVPVIVLIQAWGNENQFKKHYKEDWKDGHFVVVIGYTDKLILFGDPSLYNVGYIPISEFKDRWHDVDEGKTYQLGIAVFGKKPTFDREKLERIK